MFRSFFLCFLLPHLRDSAEDAAAACPCRDDGLSCHRCLACRAASIRQAPMVIGLREDEGEDLEEEAVSVFLKERGSRSRFF